MRLAKHALLIALVTLATIFAVSAQTMRSPDDNRNIAPTVGTGGTTGGPTGLFTIYDGQTLRRGEYTFSIAYSNFDRDPGNADFTEIPISFQIGLSDHLELFFNTDAYRGIKVNNPANLSSFYLPNSSLSFGSGVPAAIVLAPGTSGPFANSAVYRPAGAPFVQFPFVGSAGTYGFPAPFFSGTIFGNNAGGNATLGPPRAGGAADNFPGVGSVYGSILPGVVLSTQNLTCANGAVCGTGPVVYSMAPSYLPDAPFINRRYGNSAFSTYTAGAKWRFNKPEDAWGLGVVLSYRWFNDTATGNGGGFNQLQRGASPGGNRGDFGVTLFYDSRVAKWANVSANASYIYNSSVKGEFPTGTFTILDRPDEFSYGVGVDFPVNQFFQPILEFRQTIYTGGRTPNVFENNPQDVLAGVRIYPRRWFGFSLAYRYHVNSQNDVPDDAGFSQNIQTFDYPTITANAGAGAVANPLAIARFQAITSTGSLAPTFRTSTDPHGFIFQFFAGRRNARGNPPVTVQPSDVTAVDLDQSEVVLPCPPGTKSDTCRDDSSIAVRTSATNPANDTLTYNYTVSGGRIVGQGANVNWDLSGLRPGTYTITAAADNGCGFCGKTQTKTITVRDCPDCNRPCECANISVTGPSSITSYDGGTMTFTANVSGGTQTNTTYNWSVSAGTIASGQGTSVITVVGNPDLAGQTVTATVDVGGLCAGCGTTGSSSGEFSQKPPPPPDRRKVDEFGPSQYDDIKNRFQNGLAVELANNPQDVAYIVVSGSGKAKANQLRGINRAIDFLRLDRSRIRIIDGDASAPVNTEIYMVPPGAEPPTE